MTDELELLAPLHAQIDPAYPENLRMVAEWLYVQLVEDLQSPELPLAPPWLERLALLALRQTERLCSEMGGVTFYLNKAVSYRASLRDRELYGRFNGQNFKELALHYGLSTMRVRQIVGAMRDADIARRQGRLDL